MALRPDSGQPLRIRNSEIAAGRGSHEGTGESIGKESCCPAGQRTPAAHRRHTFFTAYRRAPGGPGSNESHSAGGGGYSGSAEGREVIRLDKPNETPQVLLNRGSAATEQDCDAYAQNPAAYFAGESKFRFNASIYGSTGIRGGSQETPTQQVLLLRVEAVCDFSRSDRSLSPEGRSSPMQGERQDLSRLLLASISLGKPRACLRRVQLEEVRLLST